MFRENINFYLRKTKNITYFSGGQPLWQSYFIKSVPAVYDKYNFRKFMF